MGPRKNSFSPRIEFFFSLFTNYVRSDEDLLISKTLPSVYFFKRSLVTRFSIRAHSAVLKLHRTCVQIKKSTWLYVHQKNFASP